MLVVHHHISSVFASNTARTLTRFGCFSLVMVRASVMKRSKPHSKCPPVVLRDRVNRVVALSHRKLERQVLFDGDVLVEIGVEGEVGDAKSTLA